MLLYLLNFQNIRMFQQWGFLHTNQRSNRKEKMKLSIILPIYNMEKYVRECLDNLKGIKDIEVIMVNDGSTDST